MSKSKVIAYALRVREGPGIHYDTIGFLRQNDLVEVLSTSPDGLWQKIQSEGGLIGWSAARYLESLEGETPPGSEGGESPLYRVTATALYLREGPGTNHAAIGYLRNDEIVEGLSASADGRWLKIRRANGLTGWCFVKYLERISGPSVPPEPATDSETHHYRVTAYALHLRAGAGIHHPVIGYLRRGDVVTYLGYTPQGKWMRVRRADGTTGWCSARYLIKVDKPPVSPPPQVDDLDKTGLHRVTCEVLALHRGPGEDEETIGQLVFEQVVDVLEISPERAWKHVVTARGQIGWSDTRYLDSLGDLAELQPDEEFPWMPIAFAELGMREFPGSPDNPRILEYLMSTSLREYPYSLPDETDWCAAFVNWCVEQAGVEGTGSALVAPWRRWGRPLQTPRRGCIVTFRWEDGGQHVAFYLGERGDRVFALGGNQSDAVWVKSYPTRYVTDYRAP